MTPTQAEMVIGLIVLLSFGAITAKVAADRSVPGHPLLWFIAGFLLFIIALPLAIFSKPDSRKAELKALKSADAKKCPRCAELVKREALICRYCRYEFGADDDWRVAR